MEKVKQWLDVTGTSVVDFAKLIKVSRQSVHNYLTGESVPGLLVVRRMHDVTRIPLDDLVPKDNAA